MKSLSMLRLVKPECKEETVNTVLRSNSSFYDCKYLLHNENGNFIWGEISYGPFTKIASVETDNIQVFDVEKVREYVRSEITKSLLPVNSNLTDQLSLFNDFEK